MHETLAQDRLYVTVDALILTVREGRLYLLLGKRTAPPFAGRWALPGRFVGLSESAESAVRVLLDEMLRVDDAFIEQLYTFTEANRDPRGRVISTAYLVIVPWARLVGMAGDPAARLSPFGVKLSGETLELTGDGGTRLGPGDLAFDHGDIIATGIQRLRGKLDYTDIAFRFLNDMNAFSLGELLAVHEAVQARPIDFSNFRRTILSRYEEPGRIVQTEQLGRRGRGRPAAIYRFIH